MNELWFFTSLVFVAVLVGLGGVCRAIFSTLHAHRTTNRRLASSEQARGALEQLSRNGLGDSAKPLLRRADNLLRQTGLKVNRSFLLAAFVGLHGILVFALGLALGFSVISFCLAVCIGLLLGYIFLRGMRARHIARFGKQLPEALDLIVRGVRVGYPLSISLGLVSQEMPEPIGPEFGLVADEIAFGRDIKTAVDHLYQRVGHEDLLFLAVAVSVQSQTGGNIAEVLSRMSRLVRNRAKVHLKIRALSAEGRAAAKFLSAMPFILFAIVCLVSPAYFAEVGNHPLIAPAILYAATSLILGNLIMYRMVNFKV